LSRPGQGPRADPGPASRDGARRRCSTGRGSSLPGCGRLPRPVGAGDRRPGRSMEAIVRPGSSASVRETDAFSEFARSVRGSCPECEPRHRSHIEDLESVELDLPPSRDRSMTAGSPRPLDEIPKNITRRPARPMFGSVRMASPVSSGWAMTRRSTGPTHRRRQTIPLDDHGRDRRQHRRFHQRQTSPTPQSPRASQSRLARCPRPGRRRESKRSVIDPQRLVDDPGRREGSDPDDR